MQWAERRERDQRRDERRGVEWAIFQEWAERRRGREQGGRIAELNHVGNWISYKNATLAVSLSFIHLQQPLRPTDIYAQEILLQSQSFLRYDSRSHTYGRRRPPSLPSSPARHNSTRNVVQYYLFIVLSGEPGMSNARARAAIRSPLSPPLPQYNAPC